MWLFDLFFSTILQTWYVEVRISRKFLKSPLEFEITKVDCIVIIYSVWILKENYVSEFLYS